MHLHMAQRKVSGLVNMRQSPGIARPRDLAPAKRNDVEQLHETATAWTLRWVPSPPQRNGDPPATPPVPERWVSRSPPEPHPQKRNSVEELTLLASGHKEMSPMPSLECGEWCKPFLSNLLASPRSTKGCSSFKCRTLLTYLPAHGSTNSF